MKTLELFNCVVSKPSNDEIFISEDGYIVDSNAVWAKDKIVQYYRSQRLSGNDLNKTFYKSFATVLSKTRSEIWVDQVIHYWSTYGSNFQSEVWIPEQIVQIPKLKICYKIIRGIPKEQMIEKCLAMLSSGIALKEETLNTVLSVLTDELGYQFTGEEVIRNKEAVVKIADLYGVLPVDTMEFFRYCIFRATNETLLIKNHNAVNKIKESSFNPGPLFEKHGLSRLATIFNRYKPLFLAFKNKCPRVINIISKLSKTNHQPMVQNPLNFVTSQKLKDSDMHWLDNATPFATFKALQALQSRIGGQNVFNYRIRNGKSWCVDANKAKISVVSYNLSKIVSYLATKYNLKGKKIFIPKDVEYALPTSEKMFVGNVPTGTKFLHKNLILGIYWENGWGSRDIDLSAVAVDEKIGWNSRFVSDEMVYSGDVIDASDGAAEYLALKSIIKSPKIVYANISRGESESEYKIVLSHDEEPTRVNRNYVVDPDKVIAEIKTKSVEKSNVLGFLMPDEDSNSFVLLNFGSGSARVSTTGGNRLQALYQQYRNPLSFNWLVKFLGAKIVNSPKNADFDFSLDKLDKDSFIKIFERKNG